MNTKADAPLAALSPHHYFKDDGKAVLSSCSSTDETKVSDDGMLSVGGEHREPLKSFEGEMFEFMMPDIQITMPSKEMVKLKRGESFYGHPLSEEQAAEAMPTGDRGLIWHSLIVPNEFFREGKLRKGLRKEDFNIEMQTVKPRRPSLPVTASDFFSSLTQIQGPDGPRWIFHGVLNGWPGLTCLELISLQARRKAGSCVSPRTVTRPGHLVWMHHWCADREGKTGQAPEITDDHHMYRAKLRGAPWTSTGWSEDNPGFVFWYETVQRPDGSQLKYGEKMVQSMNDDDVCTMVHMVSFRCAMKKESLVDRFTYHTIVLLEWDHGKYCTVLEIEYLNFMGGYKGKSDWYHDKNENVTELFRALPNEMIVPWLDTSAEIHCFDVEAKNLNEFKTFIKKYEGSTNRFVDPHYPFSHQARLSSRSKKDIAQYLLNYSGRNCTYALFKNNCQTFAADVCSFLAGKKIKPFQPIIRISYSPQPYLFLYDSHMYEDTKQACSREMVLLRALYP